MTEKTYSDAVLADLEEHTARQYREQIEGYARDLERLAEVVRRKGAVDPVAPIRLRIRQAGPYAEGARAVVHEVEWGLANANLSRVLSAAAEADYAIAQQAIQKAATASIEQES